MNKKKSSLASRLWRLLSGEGRRPNRDRRHRWVRLSLLALEDRAVPASVLVTPTTGLTTTEAGGTASFTVRLSEQPSSSVTIPISSSCTTIAASTACPIGTTHVLASSIGAKCSGTTFTPETSSSLKLLRLRGTSPFEQAKKGA